MNNNPRHIAIIILKKCQETGQPVDQLRDDILKKISLRLEQDKQLITALVYGVLRQRCFLDYILQGFSRHPLSKMKNLTLQALRVGLYQLYFMDRIPPSAAVNETVKALKEEGQPKWLTGFVNGVLRNIVRQINTLPTPTDKTLPPAVQSGHPDWIYNRWLARYGEAQTKNICEVNNQQPPLVLRINSKRGGHENLLIELQKKGINAQPGLYSAESITLKDYRGDISALPGFQEGKFMVQDEGAQLICHMFAPYPAGKYLDACAGVGGKTLHLAQLIPEGSQIIALEPHPGRFKLLRENIQRMGFEDNIASHQSSLEAFQAKTTDLFQAILVDAPCSGLGVIRRHPDIRWNRQPEDLIHYQTEQLRLLKLTADLLASEGILVYATCSIEPEENEEVVLQFLRNRPDFQIISPLFQSKEPIKFINEKGFLQMLPNTHHDGFFAVSLKKSQG